MSRAPGFYPKYTFIVSACKKYIPELNALFNSLDYVGNEYSVHLWEYQIPKELLSKWSDAFRYPIIIHEISEPEAREYGGEGEILCRKRYWYAGEVGQNYEAVCVLDADMVFVRDPKLFFELAETGVIIGVHKEQNKVYDHDHHTVGGKRIVPASFYNDKELCNCPLFINAQEWGSALKKSWEYFITGYPVSNFKAPDMDAMNIAFIEAGAYDRIVKLSNHAWLGTNESLLKPYTRACGDRDGRIKTENGQEVFSFHGQFYKKKWRETQLDNRHNCAEHYLGFARNSDDFARGAMNCLYEYFKKMCFGHKVVIEKKNYVDPSQPYEE